jgi:hypothetical protein
MDMLKKADAALTIYRTQGSVHQLDELITELKNIKDLKNTEAN